MLQGAALVLGSSLRHVTLVETVPSCSTGRGGKDALSMAGFSLRKMAAGGMYDHIGGGFHRYSVDEFWHVPHFEKVACPPAWRTCWCM